MIMENYHKDVTRGYLCFTRSNNHIEELRFTEKDFQHGLTVVSEILDIIDKGYYPGKSKNKNKCLDCCYNTICV